MLHTPILFLVFNRLDTTQQVFAKIREAQPRQLFIGSDGARVGKEGEADKVESVRKYILDNIDWDCEVKTLFREQNLGCGVAPAEAITWFFDHVEQGIILEDDCLPDASFFTFCEELLNYYKDNEQIMHIAGTNFQKGIQVGKASYFISKWPSGWGWATWKRAWQKYDFYAKKLNEDVLEQIATHYSFNKREKAFWYNMHETIKDGKRPDIWDLQWSFTVFINKGYAIHPQKNLISNIGFGQDATHTTQIDSELGNVPTASLEQIIFLPKEQPLEPNAQADRITFNQFSPPTPYLQHLKNQIVALIPSNLKKVVKVLLKRV